MHSRADGGLVVFSMRSDVYMFCMSMAKNTTPLDLPSLFEGTKQSLWLSLSADESQGKQKISNFQSSIVGVI